jgi:hypothetical protein
MQTYTAGAFYCVSSPCVGGTHSLPHIRPESTSHQKTAIQQRHRAPATTQQPFADTDIGALQRQSYRSATLWIRMREVLGSILCRDNGLSD